MIPCTVLQVPTLIKMLEIESCGLATKTFPTLIVMMWQKCGKVSQKCPSSQQLTSSRTVTRDISQEASNNDLKFQGKQSLETTNPQQPLDINHNRPEKT